MGHAESDAEAELARCYDEIEASTARLQASISEMIELMEALERLPGGIDALTAREQVEWARAALIRMTGLAHKMLLLIESDRELLETDGTLPPRSLQ